MGAHRFSSNGIDVRNGKNESYLLPLTLMVTLFFVFGMITVLNDILIPHFKSTFELSYTKVMLINGFFFGAYFIMGIPSSRIIDRLGYKWSIVLGLVVVSIGCLSFYPASLFLSYYLFLTSLFFIASGITLLQVAANAYVTVLGPPEKSSARISLCGGLNSTATVIGPIIGASLILNQGLFNQVELNAHKENKIQEKTQLLKAKLLETGDTEVIALFNQAEKTVDPTEAEEDPSALELSAAKEEAAAVLKASEKYIEKKRSDADLIAAASADLKKSLETVKTITNQSKAGAVPLPYFFLAIFILLVAFIFSRVKLPEIIQKKETHTANKYSALSFRHLRLGILAIFLYVGAEVVVGSLLINYIGLENILGLKENEAAWYVTLYWGCAAVARFIGFAVLQKVKPVPALLVTSGVAAVLIVNSIFTEGVLSLSTMVAVGLCHSIMWPVIFSLSLDGLGKYRTEGSGLLIMGVVGGAAIPIFQGVIADTELGLQNSFWVTVACYIYLIYYALSGYKNVNPEMSEEANEPVKANKRNQMGAKIPELTGAI